MPYFLADEGVVDGVQHVTVLTAGGDPIEYEITAEQARAEYGVSLPADRHPEY